jgi:hypothetical protein
LARRPIDVLRKMRVYWFRVNVPKAANRGTITTLIACNVLALALFGVAAAGPLEDGGAA